MKKLIKRKTTFWERIKPFSLTSVSFKKEIVELSTKELSNSDKYLIFHSNHNKYMKCTTVSLFMVLGSLQAGNKLFILLKIRRYNEHIYIFKWIINIHFS